MSPVDRDCPVTGTNLSLGSYEKFQPGSRDEKGRNKFWREIRETKQPGRNTKL